MKKLLSLFVSALIILLSCTSCAVKEDAENPKKLNIVTTIFPYYDLMKNISNSSKVSVKMLLPPGGSNHSYEPTPSDMVSISSCDILIYTGGESDEWVNSIKNNLSKNAKVIKALDFIVPKNEMDADNNKTDEIDEHIFTSIKNMIALTNIFHNILNELNVSDEKAYIKYQNELLKTDQRIKEIISKSSQNTIVVADRFPMLYFCSDYKLSWICAYPGCSAESEPSVKRVQKLTEYIRENDVKYILKIALNSEKTSAVVSEETGAKVLFLYSTETVSKKDFKKGVSYPDLMNRNADTLEKVLNK